MHGALYPIVTTGFPFLGLSIPLAYTFLTEYFACLEFGRQETTVATRI